MIRGYCECEAAGSAVLLSASILRNQLAAISCNWMRLMLGSPAGGGVTESVKLRCLSLLQPGSKKMEHKGNSWHENCFTCHRCQQPIGTRNFVQKDANNYCLPCYEKQYAQKCCYCKMVRGQKAGLRPSLFLSSGSPLWSESYR